MGAKRIAVVGGGWSGIAAAVEATRLGHSVTLFEMASELGGRARGVDVHGTRLDNGQHILIGAYVDTLALMRTVGVHADTAFVRTPLHFTDPRGAGLQLHAGRAIPAFAKAVLQQRGWSVAERLSLLATAARWASSGFRCDAAATVAMLSARLPARVRAQLIEPLCVAALNTPTADASGPVFLRVLRDALFAGPGSADLLLPRVGLTEALPAPASRWLTDAGASLRLGWRVMSVAPSGAGWHVDGDPYDAVVLATTASQAAHLTAGTAADWSASAGSLGYEPIATVYLQCDGARLSHPMLALHADAQAPAQFVFDRGQLGGAAGLLAFVVSGAKAWAALGAEATEAATMRQAAAALGHALPSAPRRVQTIIEKRATFRCMPGLRRPAMHIAPGLCAAGDYVDGPYPSTLEGAVRSGFQAARQA